MHDIESEQIRDVYALFGLAVYNAQCLERALAMFVAGLATSERFTAWDYDDRLARNFDSTLGALVTMFSEVAGPGSKPMLIELQRAVQERNELVHRYFWDRAMQLNSASGRAEILLELQGFVDHFDSLDAGLSRLTNGLMEDKGVSQEVVQAHLAKLLSGEAAPHDPRSVQNPVEITAACEWRQGDSIQCAILFTSNVGNLVLGEKGLCFGPQDIPAEHLRPKSEFAKALPSTVNPKPKKAGSWNYVIPLANDYELRVRPDEASGKKVVRFGLRRRAVKGVKR